MNGLYPGPKRIDKSVLGSKGLFAEQELTSTGVTKDVDGDLWILCAALSVP
jgi:hypothetical protein